VSIHLDAFNPKITEKGVSFFADVNAHRICCFISNEALDLLERERAETTMPSGGPDQLERFKDQWFKIKTAAYTKIQKSGFEPSEAIAINPSDFE
jgi:hypothetical protein